jgi:hypothetical protein
MDVTRQEFGTVGNSAQDQHQLVLVVSIPLKNMKVSWDDYSQYMENKNVPNHQPVNWCWTFTHL